MGAIRFLNWHLVSLIFFLVSYLKASSGEDGKFYSIFLTINFKEKSLIEVINSLHYEYFEIHFSWTKSE